MDGVFTPSDQRGHGYANAAVWGLVEACGQDTLYMHSVWDLAKFYGHFGFVAIDEKELPPPRYGNGLHGCSELRCCSEGLHALRASTPLSGNPPIER